MVVAALVAVAFLMPRPPTFALAAGATPTYAWVGFGRIPDQGSAGTVNLGHVLPAVALLCIAARRVGTRSA
ncbi:hypothetical protein [Streptomyces sp. BH055]|uniref:hypothetical protein n=1 Tax=Streptomyces sp. BH055 TaxID=3401173 RepID=UPI003BB55461